MRITALIILMLLKSATLMAADNDQIRVRQVHPVPFYILCSAIAEDNKWTSQVKLKVYQFEDRLLDYDKNLELDDIKEFDQYKALMYHAIKYSDLYFDPQLQEQQALFCAKAIESQGVFDSITYKPNSNSGSSSQDFEFDKEKENKERDKNNIIVKTFYNHFFNPEVLECDAQTAHKDNPDRIRTPVAFNDINAELAITACIKANKAAPENARVMVGLARAYNKLGKFDQSAQWLNRALELKYPFANHMRYVFGIFGEGYKKQSSSSLTYLVDKSIKLHLPVAHHARAEIYINDNKPQEAYQHLVIATKHGLETSKTWGDWCFAQAEKAEYYKNEENPWSRKFGKKQGPTSSQKAMADNFYRMAKEYYSTAPNIGNSEFYKKRLAIIEQKLAKK